MSALRGLERQSAWKSQTDENSARLAFSSASIISDGWGEFVIDKPIEFNCTFVEQPSISYGYSVISSQTDAGAILPEGSDQRIASEAGGLVTGRFPRAYAFVRSWDFDKNGFWVRAYVAVVVDTISPTVEELPSPLSDPGYQLEHCFLFAGVATKDVPAN